MIRYGAGGFFLLAGAGMIVLGIVCVHDGLRPLAWWFRLFTLTLAILSFSFGASAIAAGILLLRGRRA